MYEEAIQCYIIAIKLEPSNSNTYYFKGSAFFELKKYERAILCFNNAIKYDPKYCFDKAINISPENNSAHKNKAIALKKLRKI